MRNSSSPHPPPTHGRSSRRKVLLRLAAATLTVAALVGINAVDAYASTAALSGTAYVGTTQYTTVRTNTNLYNYVYVTGYHQSVGTGGCARLFLDNGGSLGIYTDCLGNGGATYYFHYANGSQAVPRGNFTLDMQITGACGGDGCGAIPWTGTLHYNILNYSHCKVLGTSTSATRRSTPGLRC